MNRSLVWAVILMASSVSLVYAKRAAPVELAPIRDGKLEYRAPRSAMGFVEAWQGDKLAWRRQIYVIKYDLALERDVQDVFIDNMTHKDGKLVIRNERGWLYELDLTSLQVKVVKGHLLLTRD